MSSEKWPPTTLATSANKERLSESETPPDSATGHVAKELLTSHEDKPAVESLQRWLSVFGGFLVHFVSWSPSLSYGVFQDYYTGSLPSSISASSISWIGTINTFLLIFLGVISGPLFDRGYEREVIIGGSLLAIFGLMMLSLSTTYYQIFLSLGVCNGLGGGLAYVPTIALIGKRFANNKAIALGFVTAGGAAGGVAFPIAFLNLVPRIGFPWTIRLFAFIQLGCVLVAFPLVFWGMSPDVNPPRRLIQLSAFKEPVFVTCCATNFFLFLAYYIPLYYLPSYAVEALHLPTETGLYLLAALNGASVISRITNAYLTRRMGTANLLLFSSVVSMIVILCWIRINTVAGLAIFAVLYGATIGIIVSTGPVVIAHPLISPSVHVTGTRLGMVWVFASIGGLIGSPIAGGLRETGHHTFMPGQVFCGVVMAAASFGVLVLCVCIRRYDRAHIDQ